MKCLQNHDGTAVLFLCLFVCSFLPSSSAPLGEEIKDLIEVQEMEPLPKGHEVAKRGGYPNPKNPPPDPQPANSKDKTTDQSSTETAQSATPRGGYENTMRPPPKPPKKGKTTPKADQSTAKKEEAAATNEGGAQSTKKPEGSPGKEANDGGNQGGYPIKKKPPPEPNDRQPVANSDVSASTTPKGGSENGGYPNTRAPPPDPQSKSPASESGSGGSGGYPNTRVPPNPPDDDDGATGTSAYEGSQGGADGGEEVETNYHAIFIWAALCKLHKEEEIGKCEEEFKMSLNSFTGGSNETAKQEFGYCLLRCEGCSLTSGAFTTLALMISKFWFHRLQK